jgi:alpha-beta hydrolase superfamily lysophospholipase
LAEKYPGAYVPSPESVSFWESVPYVDFVPSSSKTRVSLKTKVFHNKNSKEVVLMMTGFNEPMTKYFEVVRSFYQAGFSVCLYDHRGQCLSDREINFSTQEPQIAWVEDFSSLVDDGIDLALEAKRISNADFCHLFAHSMGGLIGSYAVAKRQDVFNGQVCVHVSRELVPILMISSRFE